MEQDQKTYALVAAAKQGDGNAFTELYNSAYQMVYHTCFGYLKNREDAEDTTQEVFIYIYNKLSELEDNYAFYGWAKIIAVHTSLNKIKAKRDNISYDDAIGSEEVLEGDDNLEMLPDTYVLRDEKRKIVMGIMEKELSEVQYQTLFMYYYNDLKIEQIAQIMEVSEGTVKTRLKSAKIKVKQGITDYENKTGDRLVINGAIPSIAMILKTSTNSVPVSVMPFAGMGAFGAAGSLAASGIAKAANLILNAGGKAVAGISKGVGGASVGAQLPGQMPQVPSVQPRVPGTHPQAPISHPQAPGQMPTNPQVPSVNPPAPGVQAPVSNPVVNPARDAAKKTASGAAKKAAGKGIVTKVVAGVVAIGVIGGGTVGIVKLINSKKDEPSETKRKKDSVETTRVESVETVPAPLAIDPFGGQQFEVGGKVTFGNYEGEDISWLVLDEKDGNYLVLSEYALSEELVHSEKVDVTWETSDIRNWLNNDFYNTVFTPTEQNGIVLTDITPEAYIDWPYVDLPKPESPAPGNTTQDRVFFLSVSEVMNYFPTETSRVAYSYKDNSLPEMWWTRSMCEERWLLNVIMQGDGFNGAIGRYRVDSIGIAIRPAMWVRPGTGAASPAEPTPEAVVPVELNIEPGDVITLGNYKGVDLTWRVLEEKDGNYLVITEWLIDHPGVNVAWNMTWGTSEVRTWLGGEFMNGTFDADTISRIQETTLVTQNEDYQQDPVREETTVDKIFILDIGELYAHFDGEKSKECYQYYDGRENDRDYYTIRGNYLEVYPSGYVDVGYYYDDNVSCVRPAMWINLEGMDVNVTHGVYPAR